MLGEIDKLIVRYGAYIAVLEQGLNELRTAHNTATQRIAQLEAELEAQASPDAFSDDPEASQDDE